MATLNEVLTALFDVLLSPIDRLSPMAGVLVLSLATAIVVLLVFKWTADQPALVATKRAIQAAIFEMRLFNDDLAALLRAQGEVLRHTMSYVRLSLAPTLWLILPILTLMLHMEFHFGYTGLATGQAALVKVQVGGAAGTPGRAGTADLWPDGATSATLEAPDAVHVETPAVFLPSEREIVWRIRPRRPGAYQLRVHVGEEVLSKALLVSDAVARRSPVRPDGGLVAQLFNPSEPPLPGGTGLAAIAVGYPERTFRIAGWDIGWSSVYVGFTLAFVLALKTLFGVTM